ncbi:hypothetical protein LEP1GSC047_0632 [Leptospira inadai serovar Lyme str. 10]|uniref:Uncharacterized protein n=1 Tax=Leptospira inadai serovar Lyme str. 10 TaxID=1049790 RepID=V6HQ22_9LEPT|nr:hypothetical protein LEP1GSC047_0632 [Leptospira inadai serovar Lyme str. 10]
MKDIPGGNFRAVVLFGSFLFVCVLAVGIFYLLKIQSDAHGLF